jgi:hypothetical protein
MNKKTADLTNIFLMPASLALAVILPFELFLISYAVLGPLHYTTEISWLDKKDYFLDSFAKKIFLPIAVLITAAAIFTKDLHLTSLLIFLSFSVAVILMSFSSWWSRLNAFALALFIGLVIGKVSFYAIIFGILLTTIIHVWLFTGLFILSGAKKDRSRLGYFSFLVFILCSLSTSIIPISNYEISDKAFLILSEDGFLLNKTLLEILNIPFASQDLISSQAALKIQTFIAFAYTYHYLNWFSKVEIIKWHKVSKTSLAISLTIWIAALSLYAYDYRLGASALLFLSILHVLLEFPLNFLSVKILLKKSSIPA